jgi:hypothetical protein
MLITMTTTTESCSECGAELPWMAYCTGCDVRTKVFDAAMNPAPGYAPSLHLDDARLVQIALELRGGARGRVRTALKAEARALAQAAKESGRWRTTRWS